MMRNVLVLGGSRGIGAAIVRHFATTGATVAFTYSGSQAAAAALAKEVGAEAIKADSANRQAVMDVVQSRGALDVLIVNSGVIMFGDPRTLDPDGVDHLIDVNVRAPYHASVEAAKQMNDGGRIIIIGSVNGDRMAFAGAAAYALSKSALQGLARGLARDFGDRGITVNVVQPGPVDTDMNPADGPMKDQMHSFMAIKRHVRTGEVAAMVAYLASADAAMVTGAMHTIDGGFGA
jgi:cyclic-di-GMP-binding biofilm dispersal mediator protein